MNGLNEDALAEVCIDTLHEWLEYFHNDPEGDQYKANRVDDMDKNGVAVFAVENMSTGEAREYEVTVTVKEL